MYLLDTCTFLWELHDDPFDRLIMATAIEEGMTLVTCDNKIKLYENMNQTW